MNNGKKSERPYPRIVTDEQHFRQQWADYFDQKGVTYAFFSAANATALQQARREAKESTTEESTTASLVPDDSSDDEDDDSVGEEGESDGDDKGARSESPASDSETDSEYDDTVYYSADDGGPGDDRTKVLTVLELEDLFMRTAPKVPRESLCLRVIFTAHSEHSN